MICFDALLQRVKGETKQTPYHSHFIILTDMKKHSTILISIMLVLSLKSFSQDFYWQYPVPCGNSCNDLQFGSNDVAWIVGSNGTFMKSTDGGNHWTYKQICQQTLNAMDFANNNIGIAVGIYHTILQTENGGDSWTAVYQDSSNYHLSDVVMINENKAFAVGDSGIILSSVDKGKNWSKKKLPDDIRLYSIDFVNENVGWVSGWYDNVWVTNDPTVYKTTDGGENWTPVATSIYGSVIGKQIQFINENVGFVSQCYDEIRKTVDGGENWELLELDIPNGMDRFHFIDEMNAWGVGSSGYNYPDNIFKTTDGGRTWSTIKYGNSVSLNAVVAKSVDEFWAVGFGGMIINTKDAGVNINKLSETPKLLTGVKDLFFIDPLHGWASADFGYVLRTENGGKNWDEYKSGSLGASKLFFINKNIGWAGSGNWSKGYIHKTTDGGKTWERVYYDNIGAISNIYFEDENNGIAIGSNHILKTNDGGVNWTNESTNDKDYSFGVSCIFDSNTWYITYGSKHVLSTKDGGNNWEEAKNVVAGYHITSIDFATQDSGWATSFANEVVSTSNGGLDWHEQQPLKVNSAIYDISFINESDGWYSNSRGQIFYTEDGGNSWEEVNNMSSNYMFTIFALDENNIWSGGNCNSIISTRNPLTSNLKRYGSKRQSVLLYPNPAQTNITLVGADGDASYKIVSLAGRTRFSGVVGDGNIDVNSLEGGVYLIEIEQDNKRDVKKLIIRK